MVDHNAVNVVAFVKENLERITELFWVNGGDFDPKLVGKQTADDLYGRLGLTVLEAFELCTIKGTIDGIMMKTDLAVHEVHRQAVMAMMHGELKRVQSIEKKPVIELCEGDTAIALLKAKPADLRSDPIPQRILLG